MLTQETIDRLLAVKRHILEEPRRFDMRFIRSPRSAAPCGTTCCIAGWLLKLAEPEATPSQRFYGEFWDNPRGEILGALEISELFGIDQDLFYDSNWPAEIRDAYLLAGTPREKANAGAGAIDSFIAANGNWGG